MSNKAKVGIGIVLGTAVGVVVGIGAHNIGAFTTVGLVIGMAVGLAARVKTK
jgi:hypothetical protein